MTLGRYDRFIGNLISGEVMVTDGKGDMGQRSGDDVLGEEGGL